MSLRAASSPTARTSGSFWGHGWQIVVDVDVFFRDEQPYRKEYCFYISFLRAFAYPPLFSVVNPKWKVCVVMLSLQYFLLISPEFEARLTFLSCVCSFKKFFFLMPLAPLNILTLRRQSVFACPWVCGHTLQSAVGVSLTCQNIFLTTVSSIPFLLCLPTLSTGDQWSPT